MVTIRWTEAEGWHDAQLVPYAPIALDPATNFIHYGQSIFEGLKAYRQPDGSIATFRPEANAAPLRPQRRPARDAGPAGGPVPRVDPARSSSRTRRTCRTTRRSRSTCGRSCSRPRSGLGVRPANEYLYVLIASPAGAYFPRGVKPVSVWLSTEYVRAAPGGTGEAKCAGNYAASLVAQAQAAAEGCDQVVWLDAHEHRWVEEMGGMNLYFVYGSGRRRPHRHPRAHRLAASRRHPRLAARRSRRISATPRRRVGSRPTTGARATRRATSPRCSPAGPPRSSPPSAR